MPRSKQNVQRNALDRDKIAKAIKVLKEKKLTLNGAAKYFQIPRTSLRRYYVYAMEGGDLEKDIRENLAVKKVFTQEQERILMNYIKEAVILKFGVTLKEVRKFAYHFAKNHLIKYPTMWDTNKIAGENWLRLFKKRYNDEISLLKPETPSMAPFLTFNKHTVKITFNNYTKALAECPPGLQAANIWNIDETELSIAHVPPHMASPDVRSEIFDEIGNTVTMIAACNAGGGFVPPMLIFPTINYSDSIMNGAPEGTIGAASPSGWSNESTFLKFMYHFIKIANPAKDRPVIVLMDNHESHISIPILRVAKDNGIMLVTLHPHTSNKMQPLRKTVFGPFKDYFDSAANEIIKIPGRMRKPLTIHDIASLVGTAFLCAFTPTNILNGFKSTGFHPLNEDIFSESEFDVGD